MPSEKTLSRCPVLYPQRDSDPSDYPVVLLDPRQCVQQLLKHIYCSLPVKTFVRKTVRNAEIYQRYKHGKSAAMLAVCTRSDGSACLIDIQQLSLQPAPSE